MMILEREKDFNLGDDAKIETRRKKKAYDLFLQNLIKGTSHLALGQEAIAGAFGVSSRG